MKPKNKSPSKHSRQKTGAPLTPEVLDAEDFNSSSDGKDTEDAAENDDEPFLTPKDIEIQSSSRLPEKKRSKVTEETDVSEQDLKAVSAYDPIRRYFDEIKRYPLLDPLEEFRLAGRIKETGDMTAAKALVSANLRLVVKIALEYKSVYSNLLDLIQEGNIGLMKAVSKFDPTKGVRLGYYASWWIRSYILKYLLDNFRLVKIGTTQAQKKLFYQLMREKDRLEAQGLSVGPKLLAEKLDVREKDIIEMEQRLSSRGAELSLDAPVDPDTGSTIFLDHLRDDHESADNVLAHEELIKLLKSKLPELKKQITERERKILKDRILSDNPSTLQEVADKYGLTRERVRQIETGVIEKLKNLLKDSLGDLMDKPKKNKL